VVWVVLWGALWLKSECFPAHDDETVMNGAPAPGVDFGVVWRRAG